MTLRCPVSRCEAANDLDADACAHCGTALAGYARMSGHPAILFNDGLAAATGGRLRAARDLFAALVHWCPESVDARNALALACFQLGDPAPARVQWTAVLDRRPTDPLATAGLRSLATDDLEDSMTQTAAPRLLTFELAPAAGTPDVAGGLRQFLLAAGATRVEPIQVGPPPSDRRTAGGLELVAFAVTLTGTVAQVVELCRGWLADRRHQGATSVELTIDGNTIVITNPSTRTEDAAIDGFIRHHGSP